MRVRGQAEQDFRFTAYFLFNMVEHIFSHWAAEMLKISASIKIRFTGNAERGSVVFELSSVDTASSP